jgi:hypothetical protein
MTDFILSVLGTVQTWLTGLGLGNDVNEFINGIFASFVDLLS